MKEATVGLIRSVQVILCIAAVLCLMTVVLSVIGFALLLVAALLEIPVNAINGGTNGN